MVLVSRLCILLNQPWQTMENLSKIFPKIFIFQVVTQAVLLENPSIKNHGYLFSFFNSGRRTERFTGKLIHSNFLTETIYLYAL